MQQRERENRRGIRAVLLLTLFLSLSICFALTDVKAAVIQLIWHDGKAETEITVEKGAKFYIGDYVDVISDGTLSTASLVKASYQSRDKKVATVNGKGYLNAKNPGMTDITVTYQGKQAVCHLTVEKKGAFAQGDAVKELQAAAKKLSKGMPKKLTAAKGFALLKKRNDYTIAYQYAGVAKLTKDGFLHERVSMPTGVLKNKKTVRLAVPEAGRYLTVEALLRQFLVANDPTSKQSKKVMRIASAEASSKTGNITIKLAKKLGSEEILAAQLAFPEYNSEGISKTKANLLMSIYDATEKKYYKGQVALKKGAKQFQVKPVVYSYSGYEEVKIVKGHVYLLGSEANWAGGKSLTAK